MHIISVLSAAELTALGVFVALWVGYTVLADYWAARRPCLQAATAAHRRVWMRALCDREVRVADSGLIGNLMRSVSFFASASVLILGGLVALIGAGDRAFSVVSELPLVAASGREAFEAKVMLLAAVFVYAFFQFTWALRQFNYCCIVIGAAPMPAAPDEAKERFAEQMGRLNALAANSFNRGLRAYYFALAMLPWFLHPAALVVSGVAVVAVLYRREFRSKTLATLTSSLPR